jgi:ketosteroid isomerase-like protein
MKSVRVPLALLLTVALAACNQGPKHDPAADAASLDKAAAGWEAAYNGKNAAAVAAIYSEDGQLLPPGAAAVNGRAAIQEFWGHDIETQWAQIAIKAETSEVAGDWAYRSGSFGVESVGFTGKFLEVWKRSGDRWLLHKDIWNADAVDAPPAEAAAPAAAESAMPAPGPMPAPK